MSHWPLHPLEHLRGFIPDLIQHQYEASLLKKLGITYQILTNMHLNSEWMQLFRFVENDWFLLGFEKDDINR